MIDSIGIGTWETWEGIAGDILGATGWDDPPVDAIELAADCGLEVRASRIHHPYSVGDTILVPRTRSRQRLHGLVAHELGHWALDRAREPSSEQGARYLAGALLLPRHAFGRDLQDTGWRWEDLRRLHPNASAEMVVYRICQLRDAVALVMDGAQVRARIVSPSLPEAYRRVTELERALADEALRSGAIAYAADLVYAVPLIRDDWRRVVVIAEAEQLSQRL